MVNSNEIFKTFIKLFSATQVIPYMYEFVTKEF